MNKTAIDFTTGAMRARRGTADAIRDEMSDLLLNDVDWRNGRLQGLNHFGGDDVLEVALNAYKDFASTNPVSRRAFPSVGQLENDIIASALHLMGGTENGAGTVTSGGTESIFLATLAARNSFKVLKPDAVPEIVLPSTAHPAFNKAADLLCLKVIRVPVTASLRADVAAMEQAISPNTMMIVGSAPCYPYGLIDPIAALATIAQKHGVWMHVDACIGGFQAPFARALGYDVPAFGLDVPGVSSISADLHKYGFALKGASVVLFASSEKREHSIFRFSDWPRGIYSTDAFSGTRSGGPVAAAWAVMRYLGHDGYVELTKLIMDARAYLIDNLPAMRCELVGQPELALVAIKPSATNLESLGQQMEERGWMLNALLEPKGIQIMLNISHVDHMEQMVSDLIASSATGVAEGAGPIYAGY